jgi:hypothetical protein
MNSQIFKKIYPITSLIEFIKKFAYYNDNINNKYYLINKSYYKRAIYMNIIDNFLHELRDYYHLSKYKYLENVNTYSKFMTIIRQLCKINNVNFASKIVYAKTSYDIAYYIYE